MSERETGRGLPDTPAEPATTDGGDGREETPLERWDRNFGELLQELRVAQTGVQILFAFLLTLPFTQRFTKITSFQKDVYFVTLLLAPAASACIIAPVAHHRILFRRRQKEYLVAVSN